MATKASNGVDLRFLAAMWNDGSIYDGTPPPGSTAKTRRAADAMANAFGSDRLRALQTVLSPDEVTKFLRLVHDGPTAEDAPAERTSARSNPRDLSFVRASDVEVEHVDWLWRSRLARGKITVLEGDPGTGKTTLALSLAAAISQGRPLPGEPDDSPPRTVIVFSGEDDIGDTLRPRLEAAGADCDRVIFENLRDPAAVPFVLPRDVEALEQAVVAHDAALVIIDPVMSYLDPSIDSHKDQSVRSALMPLVAMAQRTRVAVLLLRHLNKDSSKAAIHRGGGSIAFAGVARLVLLAAPDPDDQDAYVLARTKGNLGRRPAALCYSIASAGEAGVVLWGGESSHTADTLLAPDKPGPKPDAIEQAKSYVADLLKNGPKPRREVVEAGAKVNLSERTIDRAASALGIVSKSHGKERLWTFA